jgi:hypothetical protein
MDDGNAGCTVVGRIAEGEIGDWRGDWNLVGYHQGIGKEVFYMQFLRPHGDLPSARNAPKISRFFQILKQLY